MKAATFHHVAFLRSKSATDALRSPPPTPSTAQRTQTQGQTVMPWHCDAHGSHPWLCGAFRHRPLSNMYILKCRSEPEPRLHDAYQLCPSCHPCIRCSQPPEPSEEAQQVTVHPCALAHFSASSPPSLDASQSYIACEGPHLHAVKPITPRTGGMHVTSWKEGHRGLQQMFVQ